MVLRYKDIHAFDNTDITKIINSMYREGDVSVLRADYPTLLSWRDLGYWPADGTTRSPRMVAECLFARC